MKIYLFTLFFTIGFFACGQNCTYSDDYNNSLGWTRIDLFNTGVPTTGVARMNISSGVFNFARTVDGYNQIHMYRRLASPLCESWVAEFDFIIDSVGTDSDKKTVSHFPFSITSNQNHPFRIFSGSVTDNDAIMVYLFNNNGTGSDDMALSVMVKDSTSYIKHCESPEVSVGVNYHIILERIDGDNGRFTIINEDTQTEFHTCCFAIPEELKSLNYIQHANNPGGTLSRKLSGKIDSTCIRDCFQIDDCCLDTEINGPSIICYSEFMDSPVFSVTDNSATTYEWTATGGATLSGANTNAVTITNMSSLSGTITLSLEMTCGCKVTTLSKTIVINDDLTGEADMSAGISTVVVGSTPTNVITATALTTLTGLSHRWELYEGSDCLDPSDPILNWNNNPVMIASGTGTSFNVSGLTPPGTCYVLRHIVSYNGACEVEERQSLLSGESESEMSSSGASNTSNGNSARFGEEIRIYPNPSSGILKIELSSEEGFEYLIFDQFGKIVKKGISQNSNLILNIESLESGMYSISIKPQNGQEQQRKISIIN
jgi:hypothetical protein